MILTNEKGSSRVVLVGKSKSGDVAIGRGWNAFAKENGLREGYVIMLELVKGGVKPVMKIYGNFIPCFIKLIVFGLNLTTEFSRKAF